MRLIQSKKAMGSAAEILYSASLLFIAEQQDYDLLQLVRVGVKLLI